MFFLLQETNAVSSIITGFIFAALFVIVLILIIAILSGG